MIKIQALKNLKNIKILAIIIVLLIASVIIIKSSWELWSKNMALKTEVAQKTEELSKGANITSVGQTIDGEIKTLAAKLSQIETKFSSNTEEVFSSLNRFAETSEISLESINPLDKTEVKIPDALYTYLELPIDLELKCGYRQLLSFLNKLERAKKILLVTEIKIQSDPQDIWDHDIQLSLKVPISISTKE